MPAQSPQFPGSTQEASKDVIAQLAAQNAAAQAVPMHPPTPRRSAALHAAARDLRAVRPADAQAAEERGGDDPRAARGSGRSRRADLRRRCGCGRTSPTPRNPSGAWARAVAQHHHHAAGWPATKNRPTSPGRSQPDPGPGPKPTATGANKPKPKTPAPRAAAKTPGDEPTGLSHSRADVPPFPRIFRRSPPSPIPGFRRPPASS